MTQTNIKNLPLDPTNKYFTYVGYTQRYPYKLIALSPSRKTLTLAGLRLEPDPEWHEKIQWVTGGFAGHCPNQSEQTWIYKGINDWNIVKIRKNKDGEWRYKGRRFIEDQAVYFYDYNF